jgi:threonine/homoserine/homoserine lactone efflux protein
MLDTNLFVRGLVLGFAIAAPVGPIGVLCIRRTLAEGRLAGLVSGLGAASADAIYGFISAFGLTYIASLLLSHQTGIRLAGGLFLLYLGAKTVLAPVAEQPPAVLSLTPQPRGLMANYASTFAVTLTNPATLISYAAVFAGLGVGAASGSYGSAVLLASGVFVGSALWWLTLSSVVGLLHRRVTPHGLRWVNRVSGLVILGFGVAALASLLAWRAG